MFSVNVMLLLISAKVLTSKFDSIIYDLNKHKIEGFKISISYFVESK
jgi:hypothetical protein